MPVITDKFGKASVSSDVAIATTVKTTRLPGVLVLEANDLSKYATDTPVFVVTYKKTTDALTGAVSISQLRSWKALVNVGANTLTNLTIQPGYADDIGNAVGDFIECIPTSAWENSLIDGIFVGHNPDGSFKKAQLKADLGDDGNLTQVLDSAFSDFVLSGGVWSALTGLNAGMSLLTGYIDGYRNTVAAVATRAFTLSKDTYIDVLRNTGTNAFSLVYTEVANNAAAPALAANSMRIALVVTDGTTVVGIRQSGYDIGGNRINPNSVVDPKQPKLFWEEIGRDTVVSGTRTQLTVPIPARKYIRIIAVQHSGGVTLTSGLRFNQDAGTNYAYRTTENGAADIGASNQTWVQTGSNALEGSHAEFQVVNEAIYRKVGHAIQTFWDASGGTYRSTYAFYWQNASAQINRIDWIATLGAFRPGTELIILGHD